MKRLPLIVSVVLVLGMFVTTVPFLAVIWLLGGNDPYGHVNEACNKILGWDK